MREEGREREKGFEREMVCETGDPEIAGEPGDPETVCEASDPGMVCDPR